MAFINKQQVQEKTLKIKEICKRWGVKATVSGSNSSSITVTFVSGVLDFFGNYREVAKTRPMPEWQRKEFDNTPDTHMSMNPYWYQEQHSGDCLTFINEIISVLNEGNHDNSDIMTDYFDVGWYVHLNVGKWNKPYVLLSK
jgi:hypothetical protein